ncbi:MAG: hypothetical protein M1831_004909 [Alyxoria varia]|nr:MAG: hypothetical protein M1831_004909 [Alyxoria varia]
MASQLSNGTDERNSGVTLTELPKSNVFTSNLPADSRYPTPIDSHKAPREDLGPRLVKGALYTYVRPQQFEEPELVGVSPDAMQDIGLKQGEEETQMFKAAVAGKQIVTWDESKQEGIYPWAQCYGGVPPFLTSMSLEID